MRILTIDGGGLQGISTLLILDNILGAIAKQNGMRKKPRPCDVFDTIAGIGAGGWLAILLGRFRMDITSCLHEWQKIVNGLTATTKLKELPRRMIQNCWFDTNRLANEVEKLTKLYHRGGFLFEPNPEQARTRHVIVAASRSDTGGYNIFRSYEIPNTAKSPELLLEGPANPSQFKISSAFGVTGASNYFTPEWEEQMESSGPVKFRDADFPMPHNITGLALDEMWAIYGTDVPISVVVSIGPGLPSITDAEEIAKKGWRILDPIADYTAKSSKGRSPDAELKQRELKQQELKQREDEIEQAIKSRLDEFCPSGSGLYYRLTPACALQGTLKDDSGGVTLKPTEDFLKEPGTRSSIEEVVKRLT